LMDGDLPCLRFGLGRDKGYYASPPRFRRQP
jgi:hypothetical protein